MLIRISITIFIFPQGHEKLGVKLHKFATSLNIEDFNFVTVKKAILYLQLC